jgi:hypothetical protein
MAACAWLVARARVRPATLSDECESYKASTGHRDEDCWHQDIDWGSRRHLAILLLSAAASL